MPRLTQPTHYVVDYEWHCVAGFKNTNRRRLLTGPTGRTVVFTTRMEADIASRALLNARVYSVDEYGKHLATREEAPCS